MRRGPLAKPRDRRRIHRRERDPIGEFTQQVHTRVRDHLTIPTSHPNPLNHACNVHLASALPDKVFRRVDNVRIACHEGTSADGPPISSPNPVNDRG